MKKMAEPPFDPESFLSGTNGGSRKLACDEGEVIFSQGNAADSIFYIQAGRVKVIAFSEQGKEAIVAILGPGDFCGEGCLTAQTQRMATAGQGGHDPPAPR